MVSYRRTVSMLLLSCCLFITSTNIAEALAYNNVVLDYQFPITYYSSMYFSNETRSGQQNAIAQWNSATGIYLITISSIEHNNPDNFPANNGVSAIYCLNRPYTPYIGLNAIYTIKNSPYTYNIVVESDILYNCSFSLTNYPNIDKNSFDVESICLHEVGHIVGIDDSYASIGSAMYYSLNMGQSKRSLSIEDIITAMLRYV